MLRKLLLPMLATALLAGCATDYRYRDGNGDYYYGQSRVEYRYLGAGGYYGGFGLGYGDGFGSYGYDAGYYYDRFGRLVYGYPGGSYGSPYYGGNGWYRPRPRHGDGDHDDHDGDNDHDGNSHHDGNGHHDRRPPPWRDLGGLQQRNENEQNENENGYRNRDGRQQPVRRPRSEPYSEAPIRPQRQAPTAPVIRERSESSSRTGGFSGGAGRSRSKHGSSSGG